jgi:hypothetical protein
MSKRWPSKAKIQFEWAQSGAMDYSDWNCFTYAKKIFFIWWTNQIELWNHQMSTLKVSVVYLFNKVFKKSTWIIMFLLWRYLFYWSFSPIYWSFKPNLLLKVYIFTDQCLLVINLKILIILIKILIFSYLPLYN